MKIGIMGSGGVGGYYGARLARGGADVTFIARGAHLEAMRRNGIAIEGGPDPIHVPAVNVTSDPGEAGVCDLVVFAVKLWDTEDALRSIRPMVGPGTAIVSFQNGVLKDAYLRAAYDPSQIMGGVTYVATTIDRPGVIKQTGPMQRLIFGEFGGARSARAESFLEACRNGGVNAEIADDIEKEIWQKFVFLLGMSGATATMRSKIGPIRSNPQTRAFFLDLMREVVAVGRAQGVNLDEDYAEQRLKLADEVSPEMTTSMHHDLERGNPLEVRWLAGAVVSLGAKAGVPTPLNRAVHDILALYVEGRRA